MNKHKYHIPVLLNEVLQSFEGCPEGLILDVTFGGGGHSQALLEKYPNIKIIGFDWDKDAVDRGHELVDKYDGRLELLFGNFGHLYRLLKKHKINKVSGILADFGTSQHQIHNKDGFSVHNDTPLDMRMSMAHYKVTAAEIVNYGKAEELRQIFWEFGEERNAKRIVEAIMEARKKKLIKTTARLAEIVESVSPHVRATKIHPATRVFQALRIFVNKEIENIQAFLPVAFDHLEVGGRLSCISFHSLEDRMVKHFFQEKVRATQGSLLFKKAVSASDEELADNRASRSAKLRVIEKI